MTDGQSELKIKHTHPKFWKFVVAYVLLICGTVIIIVDLVGWAFFGRTGSVLTGLIAIWMGVVALHNARNNSG